MNPHVSMNQILVSGDQLLYTTKFHQIIFILFCKYPPASPNHAQVCLLKLHTADLYKIRLHSQTIWVEHYCNSNLTWYSSNDYESLTLLDQKVRSLCEITVWDHCVGSLCGITLYDHSFGSLSEITPWDHSVRSLCGITLLDHFVDHSMGSFHEITLLDHFVGSLC